jgi:hypothetical protein
MAAFIIESEIERFERFAKVEAKSISIRSTLKSIYHYVAPNRVNFSGTPDSGNIMTSDVWNSVPIAGVRSWATNVMSVLMPPFKRWYKLVPGNIVRDSKMLTPSQKDVITKELEEITLKVFENLNQSNFYQVIHESFQDLAISTGVIAINEEKGTIPFSFISIPIDQIYFEENGKGELKNFWRSIHMKARFIKEKWDLYKLSFSSALQTLIENSPDEEIHLIEGSLEYPQNDEDHRYFYYVQDAKSRKDILTEWRSYSPFVGFRINKRPGETYGWSVAYEYFPDINVLNLISHYLLKSAKFKAFPAYLVTKSGALNPYTAIIEPGSIIPVAPDFYQNPPIAPLESGGDPNFAQLSIERLEKRISQAFAIQPLGEVQQTQNRTATEMQLRQANWIRENATGIGRLANELIRPLITTILTILRKNGLIGDIGARFGEEIIKIDASTVWIDYQSPLIGIQDQDDAQKVTNFIQILTSFFGTAGLAIMDVPKIPIYLAQKMDIPSEIVKNESQIRAILDQFVKGALAPPLEQQKLEELAGEEQPPPPVAHSVSTPEMPRGEL